MPTQDFNVGSDATLDIIDPVQGLQRFRIVTSFEHDPIYKNLESIGIDGANRFAEIPAGHKLTFELDRADGSVDAYFCNVEQNYYNGSTLANVSITKTVRERNGSVSQYRFKGVAMKLAKGGK